MTLAHPKLAAVEAEYRALYPRASALCAELGKQLSYLIEHAGVALAIPVQSRVKEWDSLAKKLRGLPECTYGLGDIQDLVGLRLILLFRRDIERVGVAIEKSLRVIRVYDTDQL